AEGGEQFAWLRWSIVFLLPTDLVFQNRFALYECTIFLKSTLPFRRFFNISNKAFDCQSGQSIVFLIKVARNFAHERFLRCHDLADHTHRPVVTKQLARYCKL